MLCREPHSEHYSSGDRGGDRGGDRNGRQSPLCVFSDTSLLPLSGVEVRMITPDMQLIYARIARPRHMRRRREVQ